MSANAMKLGNVCRMDRRVTSASAALSQGLKFVGMEHVDPETGQIKLGRGSRTGEGKSQAFLFDDRHVLFGKLRPYLRKIGLPRQSGCSSTELVPLLPEADRLDRGYLFHWIRRKAVIDTLMAKNTGARMPRADMSVLLDMSIALPSLEHQRRIVSLLDRAADIRRRANAARAKARAILPALFLDMFGDPAATPNRWEIRRLDDVIAKVAGGKNVEAGDGSSPYRIMKVSAVTSGYFRPEESKPAPNGYRPPPDHCIRRGDFLFTRANTSDLVGAVAIVEADPEGLLLPDKVWRIEWRPHEMDARFAYSLLQSGAIRRTFAKVASGTSDSMKNISQAKLRAIEVPMPPIELQTAFSNEAEQLEGITRALDAAGAKAEAMAAALTAECLG